MFLGGFLLFLIIFVMAFWILLFLTAIALPYAIGTWIKYKINPSSFDEEVDS